MISFMLVPLWIPLLASSRNCLSLGSIVLNGFNHTVVNTENLSPGGISCFMTYSPFKEFLPAKTKGVYTILDQNNKVKYVGSSNDISKRVKRHMLSHLVEERDLVVAAIFHKWTKQSQVLAHEKEEIKRLNPSKNKCSGTPGRNWKEDHVDKFKKFYELNKNDIAANNCEIIQKFLYGKKISSYDNKVIGSFLRVMKYFK